MDKIKSTQKTIELNNSREWKIKTVDTLLVKKIAFGSISDLVKNVLMTKIYRTEDEKNISDISYYFNDSKYYIFYNSYKVKDSVLLIVDNIYQFKSIAFNKSIVFDTDSSFHLIQGAYDPRSSKRKVIENVYKNYRPFEISTIGSHKVTFSYWYYHYDEDSGMLQTKERNILYKSDTDELIQDLDNKLNGK